MKLLKDLMFDQRMMMLHPNLYINAFYAYFDIEKFHTVHIIVAHTAEKMKH